MFDGKPIRLIGMSGSLRTGSYSNAVLATLRETFAGRADLELYDLAPIPLYNQDSRATSNLSRGFGPSS
jgi:chromate reductase